MAHILLVEDEQLLRSSLVRCFEVEGHTVSAAANLAQASETLVEAQPALLLLDLSLPDGHGLDFLEHNLDRLRGTKVLVFSAAASRHDVERARQLGAAEVLMKPVQHRALLSLVNKLLGPSSGCS